MIPTWTVMDLERAREEAKKNPFKGSTTPLLDTLGLKASYGQGGVPYIPEEQIRFWLVYYLNDHETRCGPANCKAPGLHPWDAEILLKKKIGSILTSNRNVLS